MWKWSKSYIFISLFLSLCQPFLGIVTLLFDRYVINSLFSKDKNLFLVFAVYIIVLCLFYIVLNYFQQKFEALNNSVQLNYQYLLYEKNMKTDYENVEKVLEVDV